MDDKTKADILKVVNANYLDDVITTSRDKYVCKRCSDFFEPIGQILIASGIVVTFAAPSFNVSFLPYIAGSLGVVGSALIKLASYAMKESSERTKELNMLLDSIGIKQIPDIAVNSAENETIREIIKVDV